MEIDGTICLASKVISSSILSDSWFSIRNYFTRILTSRPEVALLGKDVAGLGARMPGFSGEWQRRTFLENYARAHPCSSLGRSVGQSSRQHELLRPKDLCPGAARLQHPSGYARLRPSARRCPSEARTSGRADHDVWLVAGGGGGGDVLSQNTGNLSQVQGRGRFP
jgi:hypothetical protein